MILKNIDDRIKSTMRSIRGKTIQYSGLEVKGTVKVRANVPAINPSETGITIIVCVADAQPQLVEHIERQPEIKP